MPIRLDAVALEKKTYVISFSLTDEDGDAVTPVTLSWTLTDTTGAVINSRQDVVIDPPVASGYIVLQGDDLKLQTGETHYAWRIVTIGGTYNSDKGSGLPLGEEIWFKVVNLVAI